MFSDDQIRFPYHPKGTNKPRPSTVENYSNFVREAKLDHTVIVQSEVYQDDHRYLEYCFEHEPSPGYFKGTCLFDPIDPKTPAGIEFDTTFAFQESSVLQFLQQHSTFPRNQ
jgi:predicted TIM-barrel fold metal-dependent hydrolase